MTDFNALLRLATVRRLPQPQAAEEEKPEGFMGGVQDETLPAQPSMNTSCAGPQPTASVECPPMTCSGHSHDG